MTHEADAHYVIAKWLLLLLLLLLPLPRRRWSSH
jgi:hypothetical protein